jgi:hypothetical protein
MSIGSVSAEKSEQHEPTKEPLTGKTAENYIKAVERNGNFQDISSSSSLIKKKAQVERYELKSDDFNNDIVIIQSKIDDKQNETGILAIIDEKTYEVLSFTTVNENDDLTGLIFTEYDGESGEVLLQNNVIDNEVVKDASDQIQLSKIDKGSYWWKVICNLATSGSCSLGCLSLIAVPGGYPACTLLCSAFAGGAAC